MQRCSDCERKKRDQEWRHARMVPVTSPRTNPDRELFGIIGSASDAKGEQAWWNAMFTGHDIDAFMDYYPTKAGNLPERLSEMFHFDRRGYIVGKSLQEAIIPLLDRLDASASEEAPLRFGSSAGQGSVDTVMNERGVLVGHFCNGDQEERRRLWGVGE